MNLWSRWHHLWWRPYRAPPHAWHRFALGRQHVSGNQLPKRAVSFYEEKAIKILTD